MDITQTMLDVCEEALYLIRQDVTLPTLEDAPTDAGMEWTKCRRAFDYAAAEVLAAHDWVFARGESPAATTVDCWPLNVRKALVYCLARELAVQIAGRTEDMKNWHALYQRILTDARLKDLSEDVSDDPLVREVMAIFRDFAPGDAETLPRSMATFHRRILAMKRLAAGEVLSSHPWAFATEEATEFSGRLVETGIGDYAHFVPEPPDCVRVVGVYGPAGDRLDWERIGGEIRANGRVARVKYVRNVDDLARFSPDAYRLVVLRLAADVAKAVAGSDVRELQERIYRDALAEAKCRDARQSSPGPRVVWGGNHYVDRMTGRPL